MTIEKNIPFNLFPVAGIRLGTACAGIKKKDHRDILLLEIAEGSETVAVFTQNAFCAAPVTISKKHLQRNLLKLPQKRQPLRKKKSKKWMLQPKPMRKQNKTPIERKN